MVTPSTRRSSAEVRTQIIQAATEEFSAHGYADATMRGVAATADVSLSVLHRHFASKQDLFSAALGTPFMRFFNDFASAWAEHVEEPWTDRELTREFVSRLYKHLSDYRSTLVGLIAFGEPNSKLLASISENLDETRAKLRTLEERDARTRGSGLSADASPHANRMIVALVTGLVVLHPFLTQGGAEEDDQLIETATDVLLSGVWRSGPANRAGAQP
jgi:AcrR family transcriptional regulator